MKAEQSRCKVLGRYQSGGEVVYELGSSDAKLEIRISSQAAGPGARSWHVAALDGAMPDAIAISDSAETKRAALSKVAAQWVQQQAELGLTVFDWDAVAAALLAVRGI